MERKGREGVENLARVFQETPRFGDEEAQADVQEKLRQLKQTLAFLEATRYKIQCVLLSLDGQLRPSHPLSAHIEQHRDKQGHPQSILKIPTWIARGGIDTERTDSQNSDNSEGELKLGIPTVHVWDGLFEVFVPPALQYHETHFFLHYRDSFGRIRCCGQQLVRLGLRRR